jgi:hypothetical protein
MTTSLPPMCYSCFHFIDNQSDYPKCDAYPDGIPSAIFYWDADHRESQPDDHGIVFAQDPVKRPFDMSVADAVFKK